MKTQMKNKGKLNKFTFRQFFIDDTGYNYVLLKQNDKIIKIYLKLLEHGNKFIGTVTKSTRTIEMKRIESKHLFYKFNAYGFNDYILRTRTTFDWIRLKDDKGNHWKIPVNFILENGKHLNFKQQGFELQIFVPLNMLEQFRVQSKENRRL
jgi:hypothetical protein